MAEPEKTKVSHEEVENGGLRDMPEPVPDFTAPNQEQIDKMILFIHESLRERRPVAVTCDAGKGRTGAILACYLVSIGHSANDSIAEIGTIGVEAQKQAVREYENRIRKKRTFFQH